MGHGLGHGKGDTSATADSHGKGHTGHGLGHSKGHSGISGLGHNENVNANGMTTAALGSLNAAHASEMGLANAAPNSVVGQISAYLDAISEDPANVEDAAQALAAAANKSIDQAVVEAVNGLLGLDVDTETEAAVAEAVAEAQAAEAEATAESDDGTSEDTDE